VAIIVNVLGGLGNQMFQYAFGRSVSLKTSAPLKLDLLDFEGYELHAYGLHHLNIQAEVASREEVQRLRKRRPWYLTKRMYKKLNAALPPRGPYVRERGPAFDSKMLNLKPPVYLEGYWQSEKYFSECADTIRADFQVKTPPDQHNLEMLNQLAKEECPVCIHVRRGDYVQSAQHGLCSLDYYRQGASVIAEKHPRAHFFAFSDDPQWVRENLQLPYPTTVVDHNDAAHNYEDLRLMMSCRHFIVANSSFSWWGAWRGAAPDKMVIAPKRWVLDPALASADLIPPTWMQI
jgi:hypothetical protein